MVCLMPGQTVMPFFNERNCCKISIKNGHFQLCSRFLKNFQKMLVVGQITFLETEVVTEALTKVKPKASLSLSLSLSLFD